MEALTRQIAENSSVDGGVVIARMLESTTAGARALPGTPHSSSF